MSGESNIRTYLAKDGVSEKDIKNIFSTLNEKDISSYVKGLGLGGEDHSCEITKRLVPQLLTLFYEDSSYAKIFIKNEMVK